MTASESPTHPDAPRAGGETPDILADLERYLDAYRDAIIAEQSAGPEYAAFDPDVDRAYERVNNLGTELRAKMAANQTAAASLLERHRDGERDLVGHPRFGDNGGRDEIELFLRDAYAAGANAAHQRSLVTAMEYAAREAPKLRAAMSAPPSPERASK